MSKGATPGTAELDRAGIPYSLHAHEYDPEATAKGIQAAESLGVPAEEVFKTLMVLLDGTRPACAIIPAPLRLRLKAVATLLGAKSAAMMAPTDAERLTAYKTGGISPFGQKKRVPTVLDARALDYPTIYVNAGRRGLQCRIDPKAAAEHFGWAVTSAAE